MRANSLKWFILLFSWSLVNMSHAQEDGKKTLREVLNEVEERFSVHFSYMDQPIDSIEVELPAERLDLPQTLRYLEERIGLEFIRIDDYYISIKVKEAENKVCGYLIDADDGTPVSDALVFTQTDFTTTDSNGYFELPAKASLLAVQSKHVSYQDLNLDYDWSSGDCSEFMLTPAISRLDEIVIENYIVRGIDKRENGETVVDVQNMNILPGLTEPDVFFALQNLPGIQSINETVTDINIRGGSNDQNLVLWDGIRLYQTGHFFGLISAINPHTLGKATLIKNGTPAMLGEGVSGTMLLETREIESNEVTFHGGSNLINSDLLLEIPGEKVAILLASRQSIGGLFNTPTYQQYFDRAFRFSDVINDPNSQVINTEETFSFYDLSLNASYKPSNAASIESGFLLLDNGIDYRETGLISSRVESRVSNLDQSTMASYFSYNQRWTDRFSTEFYSSIMNYKQESINFDVLAGQEHILENEILESTVRADAFYYLNEIWDFKGGVQLVETGIRNFRNINRPQLRALSKEVIRTSSLYLESHASFFSKTSLTFGLRASFFDKLSKYRIEPRLNLVTKLGGSFFLEILAESKSQTNVQVVDFQTDFLGVENRKWELVNGGSIPLLTSSQASIGFSYKKPFLLISMIGFLKEVDGLVTSSQGFLNQFEFIRTSGTYDARGVELLVNPSFGPLDSWITYAYLDSDYSFSDLTPPEFRSNFDIRHALSVGLSYRLKKWELSSGANYRSGMPFTRASGIDEDGDEILFDSPNASILDSYLRVDLSAKYTFSFSDKLSGNCGISVWNLTNRENVINTFSSISEAGELLQVNQSALGITPNLSCRMVYKL